MPSAATVTEESVTRRSERIAARPAKPSSAAVGAGSHSLILSNNTKGIFTIDDILILWEVKSSSSALTNRDDLSNFILKATEVFRFQWQCRFVLGFLVCGKKMRMVRFKKAGVFWGRVVDAVDVLTKRILACLVMKPEDFGIPDDSHCPSTVMVDGKLRLVVQVQDKKFILGDQIIGPRRDHLVGQTTCVHLARGISDKSWGYCYKTAWSYVTRQYEGLVLEELHLREVSGVVRLFAWDAPLIEGTLSADEVCHNYQLQALSTRSFLVTLLASGDQQSNAEIGLDDDSAPANDDFHPRQYRQTVTEYMPGGFAVLICPGPLDLLIAWRSLYQVIDAIAEKGWVHRDLSWNNVRLRRDHNSTGSLLSAVLIDFDLAAHINGPSTGSPDKTGTSTFMPIEILESTNETPVHHQELHEDEVVFWIGFLALIWRSASGYNFVRDSLESPYVSLCSLAKTKSMMLLPAFQRKFWFGVQDQSNTILHELCRRIMKIQFTNDAGDPCDYEYPNVMEVDELALCRKHKTQHKRVLREILKELGKAIDEVMKL